MVFEVFIANLLNWSLCLSAGILTAVEKGHKKTLFCHLLTAR